MRSQSLFFRLTFEYLEQFFGQKANFGNLAPKFLEQKFRSNEKGFWWFCFFVGAAVWGSGNFLGGGFLFGLVYAVLRLLLLKKNLPFTVRKCCCCKPVSFQKMGFLMFTKVVGKFFCLLENAVLSLFRVSNNFSSA